MQAKSFLTLWPRMTNISASRHIGYTDCRGQRVKAQQLSKHRTVTGLAFLRRSPLRTCPRSTKPTARRDSSLCPYFSSTQRCLPFSEASVYNRYRPCKCDAVEHSPKNIKTNLLMQLHSC